MEPCDRPTAKGWKWLLSLSNERIVVQKVQINCRTTATGTKISLSTINKSFFDITSNLTQQESNCSKTTKKNEMKIKIKSRLLFATAHGDKDLTFRSDESNIELFCHNEHCYVCRKRGRFASQRTLSQSWSTGSCHFAAGGTGALDKIDGSGRKEYWSSITGHHSGS